MNRNHTIEIRLPDDRVLGEDELNVLRTACEALVGLSCKPQGEHMAQVRAMQGQGWQVQCDLAWHARAEREREYEEASGATPAEALCKLCQLLGLHSIEGCP